MKKIKFLLFLIILGMSESANSQAIWSESDTILITENDTGFETIITFGASCFQCHLPTSVTVTGLYPSMKDTSLNKTVSFELVYENIIDQRLKDTLYDGNTQSVSYRVKIHRPIARKMYEVMVTFPQKLENHYPETRYYSPTVVNKKVIIVKPPLVEFYANPDSTNRTIPTFVGVKNVLIGSYVLVNNHPTKKMHVSFVGLGFKDTSTWQYLAGVGQKETIPSEVGPNDSIMFNFWIQLKSLAPGTDIDLILYLKCWYDDTLLHVSSRGQSMQTEPVTVGIQKIEKVTSNFYPNPCTNYLMVSGVQEKPEVFNMLGQKMEVSIDKINNDQWKINTDLLSNGFYFINGQKFFKQ